MKWFDNLKDWLIKRLGGYTEPEYNEQLELWAKAKSENTDLMKQLEAAQHARSYAESRWAETERKLRDATRSDYIKAPVYVPTITRVDHKDISVTARIAYPRYEHADFIRESLRNSLCRIVDKLLPLAAVYYHYDPARMEQCYTIRLNVNDMSSLSCLPNPEVQSNETT